jgi:hypothetical protein
MMEDPVDISQRVDRLVKRVQRRDDYGRLLARGEVFMRAERVDDPEAWRAEIKRQARADRIKVRTGKTGSKVWAVLQGPVPETQVAEAERFFHLWEELKLRAARRGHSPKVKLSDGGEALFGCEQCDAEGYAHAASEPLVGGTLFEKDCPNGKPSGAPNAT